MEDTQMKATELYSDYLIENHSDTLHSKDQLIDAQENGLYLEEFGEWVKENA